MSAFTQDFIIQPAGRKKHKTGAMDVPARLWNPDGTPFTAFGGVKKGTAVADVAAPTQPSRPAPRQPRPSSTPWWPN